MPKFQDPTQTPSWLTPTAYSHFKYQLAHENMDTKLSENIPYQKVRGAIQKKISQIVEKGHKGGGVKSKIKKVYISNVDYFD